jgi:hypothetical protein
MATQDKIKETFDSYEVKSSVDSVFGDWVVSKDADVINVEKKYPIYAAQVENSSLDSWMSHMSEKTWFDFQENADFQNAFERAKEILGI